MKRKRKKDREVCFTMQKIPLLFPSSLVFIGSLRDATGIYMIPENWTAPRLTGGIYSTVRSRRCTFAEKYMPPLPPFVLRRLVSYTKAHRASRANWIIDDQTRNPIKSLGKGFILHLYRFNAVARHSHVGTHTHTHTHIHTHTEARASRPILLADCKISHSDDRSRLPEHADSPIFRSPTIDLAFYSSREASISASRKWLVRFRKRGRTCAV